MVSPSLFHLALAAAAVSASAARGSPRQIVVDTAASNVAFAVHATVDSFTGTVENWKLDLTVPEGSKVPDSAVFSAEFAALKTGKTARDREMLHWVDSERFPKLEWRMKSIASARDGDSGYIAEGELNLHGLARPLAVPVTIETDGERYTIRGEATIDHRLFDLKVIRKFGVLTVRPEVKVAFSVVGTLR